MQVVSKKFVVLGTGGTIAGRLLPDGHGYQAGAMPLSALLTTLSAARDTLELVDVAQVDSKDMDLPVWRALVAALASALARPEVQGVLVTHGTDTVEDTAWLVQALFGHWAKPIVFTCAMRPADHVAPDGPGNLADALAVLRDPQAAGRGVLLVCAGQVHAARHVRKAKAWALDAFTSDSAGAEGWVSKGQVRWRAQPARLAQQAAGVERPGRAAAPAGGVLHTMAVSSRMRAEHQGSIQGLTPNFWRETGHTAENVDEQEGLDDLNLSAQAAELARQRLATQDWPWVELVSSSALASPRVLPALTQAGVQGVVIAATGAGAVHQALLAAAHALAVPLVLACSSDMAGMPIQAGDWPTTGLSPRKARISLALQVLSEA